MNTSPTNTLPGADDITREVLPNGITVLVRSNFNNPSVVINGYLNTGAIFDPDEKLGLANFTAAMLMRGTDQKNFNQIFEISGIFRSQPGVWRQYPYHQFLGKST